MRTLSILSSVNDTFSSWIFKVFVAFLFAVVIYSSNNDKVEVPVLENNPVVESVEVKTENVEVETLSTSNEFKNVA